MDSDERAMVTEMQEQIAALQWQVTRLTEQQDMMRAHLYLCIKFNYASCNPKAHTSWAARFKAAGEQLSALLPKLQ